MAPDYETFRQAVLHRDVFMFWALSVLAVGWLLFEHFYVTRLENIIRECSRCRARAGLKKHKDTPSSRPPTTKNGA